MASDDPTVRKRAESGLNTVLRGIRTPKGFLAAYTVLTASVYLVGEWSNPYEPLARGVVGVVLLYGFAFLLVQLVRSDIRYTTDADPAERPTGATGEPLSSVFFGYAFVGGCALLGGVYLGGWYVTHNPEAVTFGRDHYFAGLTLCVLAVVVAFLETYETYLDTSVQDLLADRFGRDDSEVGEGGE